MQHDITSTSSVKKLIYKVVASAYADYSRASSASWNYPEFNLCLVGDVLTVEMKEGFTEPDAVKIIGSFLRNWEIHIGLEYNPQEIIFKLERIEFSAEPKVSRCFVSVAGDTILVNRRTKYPDPPADFEASERVENMFRRYEMYCHGKEPLSSMVYFCLDYLENSVGGKDKIASRYNIALPVLKKLGQLSSTRGSIVEARKGIKDQGYAPLSESEKVWMLMAIRKIIQRVGERVDSKPQITMSDLSAL